MSELTRLISRLERGIENSSSYIQTIRHPRLLVKSLQELNDLIGNDDVKDAVATQISHLIMVKRRAMDHPEIKEDKVMLNTNLYGPPGVGKTLVGTKLAKIWYSLGYLNTPRTKVSTHDDTRPEISDVLGDMMADNGSSDNTLFLTYIILLFVLLLVSLLSIAWSFYSRFGGYWTIAATIIILVLIAVVAVAAASSMEDDAQAHGAYHQQKVDKTKQENKGVDVHGEIMPADEDIITIVTRTDFVDRYVGWSDKKTLKLLKANLGKVLFVDEAYSLVTDAHDSFGIEILTTINLFISQHPGEIILIFAGYKDLMANGIFAFQPGLKRRFMWQFECAGYNDEQLFQIFCMQLRDKGWDLLDEEKTRPLFTVYQSAFPAYGGDTERLTFFSELEHSRDYIRNENGMTLNKLSTDHVHRGIKKLIENNIADDEEGESNNPQVNLMRMLKQMGGGRVAPHRA